MQAAALCDAGCSPMCAAGCSPMFWRLQPHVRLCQVALLLLETGADPYAAAQGGESAIDALRRIGGKSSMELHAELTSRVASRGAAHVATPGAAVAALPALAAAGGGSEGEEGEEEGEEEEEEAEREAAKALAASASREVMLPSLYPHPLEPCVKGSYCDHRGPGCNFYPTVYSSVEYVDGCTWGVCQVHVDICMQIHIYM